MRISNSIVRLRPRAAALVTAGLALGLGACVADDDPTTVSGNDPPSIGYDEFRAGVEQEPWPGGAYIVDGDIALFGDDALRDFYDRWQSQGQGGALTVRNVLGVDKIWASMPAHRITYCVSDSFGGQKAEVVTAMRRAGESWSDLASVEFRYLPAHDGSCTTSNDSVVFDVRPVTSVSYIARAFFPDDGRAAREVLIAPDAFTSNQPDLDLEGILRHELGHTLGFRHEHIHISCTAEDTDDSRQVTSYDVDSVMHYPQCRPDGGGGFRQTRFDTGGSITLYGLSAQLIATVVN